MQVSRVLCCILKCYLFSLVGAIQKQPVVVGRFLGGSQSVQLKITFYLGKAVSFAEYSFVIFNADLGLILSWLLKVGNDFKC